MFCVEGEMSEKGSTRMKQITNKVYLLESTKALSNCYLIKGEEMILIDTNFSFNKKAILKELEENQISVKEIKHIILTHGDLDHIGNAGNFQALSGAKVWAGAEEIPYIMGKKARPGFKKYLAMFIRPKKPVEIQPLKDGDKVCEVEVVATPGHTPGHICLIYDGALFAGDLVEERDQMPIPYPVKWNWDTSKLFKSIEKLKAYPFEWICMGHGRPVVRDELFGE